MPALVRNVSGLQLVAYIRLSTSIKREIGHLCHDEQRPPKNSAKHEVTVTGSAEPSRPLTRAIALCLAGKR